MSARGWLEGQKAPAEWSSAAPVLDPGPVVLIDTREQLPLTPWHLEGGRRYRLATQRATLPEGDYSILGLEAHVAVERKSLPDLVSTLFSGGKNSVGEAAPNQARFRSELTRLRVHSLRLLLVEGSRVDVWNHRYQSKTEPLSVVNAVDAMMLDYGINVVWAGNPEEAGRILGFILHRIWEQSQAGSAAAKKAIARGVAPFLPWTGRSS